MRIRDLRTAFSSYLRPDVHRHDQTPPTAITPVPEYSVEENDKLCFLNWIGAAIDKNPDNPAVVAALNRLMLKVSSTLPTSRCFADWISDEIDKDSDNRAITTTLNTLGIKVLCTLTAPMPDWAQRLWEKFYS